MGGNDHEPKIIEGSGSKKGWTQNPSNNCFCRHPLVRNPFDLHCSYLNINSLVQLTGERGKGIVRGKSRKSWERRPSFMLCRPVKIPLTNQRILLDKRIYYLGFGCFLTIPDFADWTNGNLKWYIIAGKFAQDGQEHFYFRDMSQMSAMVSDHSGYPKPKFVPSRMYRIDTGSIFAQILRKIP